LPEINVKNIGINFISNLLSFSTENNDSNSSGSENNITVTEVIKKLKPNELNPSSQNRVSSLIEKLSNIEKKGDEENIWTKIYSTYQTYKELKARQRLG